MKTCTKCGQSKPLDGFHRDARAGDGHKSHCKACAAARWATYSNGSRAAELRAKAYRYRERHRDRVLEQKRVWRAARPGIDHGLTPEQYALLLAAQDGRCAICSTDDPGHPGFRRLSVDHDHGHCSGRVGCPACIRGLLCHPCNNRLRQHDDDPVRLADAGFPDAAAYLNRYNELLSSSTA